MIEFFKKNIFIILLFFFVIIYLLFSYLKSYLQINSYTYTVTRDSMSLIEKTKSFLLLDEEVYTSNSNGYLFKLYDNNSYISNKTDVALVLNNIFYDNAIKEENYIKINNLKNIKNSIRELTDVNLNSIYYSIANDDISFSNKKNISIEYVSTKAPINYILKTNNSGILSYNIDGFEHVSIDNFDNKYTNMMYKRKELKNFDVVKPNDAIFKIIKSDTYKLAFKSDYNFDNAYDKEINVRFIDYNINTKTKIKSFINNNNEKYYYIELDDYLINLLNNRIINLDISLNSNKGLKIPLSSITSINCYQIPKKFVFFDDTLNTYYVKKINKLGDIVNTEIRVIKIDNNYYYINDKDVYNKISIGEYLKSDDENNYEITNYTLINGVNIKDRGLESFKNIDILDKNQEYAIISENTYNGIKIGDKIALNSSN